MKQKRVLSYEAVTPAQRRGRIIFLSVIIATALLWTLLRMAIPRSWPSEAPVYQGIADQVSYRQRVDDILKQFGGDQVQAVRRQKLLVEIQAARKSGLVPLPSGSSTIGELELAVAIVMFGNPSTQEEEFMQFYRQNYSKHELDLRIRLRKARE